MDDLLLQKYLRNETSEEELVEVLDWLDASTENQRYLDRLDYISNLNILAGEAQPRIRRHTVSLWKRTAQWSAAAAAALLVCAGVSHYLADRILEYRTRDMMAITAPNGQSMSVTLSDGTTVWLNSGAKLEYPSIFSRKTRRVKISGEAMFEVKHDASRPFIVETFACDAEVLGTKFNVKARSEDGEFVASLVEGKVRVTDRFNSNNQVELHPREQVTHLNGRLILGRIPEHEGFLWREGLIAFRDASFGDLLDEFEKYYGVKIEVRRQDMPTNLFTGKIRISEGIDHALWVLQQSADFQYTRNELKDMIYIH